METRELTIVIPTYRLRDVGQAVEEYDQRRGSRNESSGPCLTRSEGNDEELQTAAVRNAQALAAGHVFVLIMHELDPAHRTFVLV